MDKAKLIIEKARSFVFRRQRAYQETFKESELCKEVLKDLENFCRGNDTTFLPDARAHALLEGRREVWLRIQHHLKLSSEELWEKYSKQKE